MVDRLGAAAVAKKDPGEIVSLDLAFHEYVCCLADHSRLLSAWKSLRMQTRMLVSISSRTHYGQPEGPGERHQWVLDAMKTRELERAEYYLVDHIKDGQMRSLKALQMINMENGD